MRDAWDTLSGSARGPAGRLSPQARILCGASVFTACLVAPASTAEGIAAVAAALTAWLFLTRPPARLILSTLTLGLVLFLPYFLLTPLIVSGGSRTDWTDALSVPWAVFFRGITSMTAAISTASTLSMSSLRRGLCCLPVPEIVSAVLLQIVHQTVNLVCETRRIAQAVAVRGGTRGYRTALRLVSSLPRVWLPRVVDRGERAADAMEVRGYRQHDITPRRTATWSPTDFSAIGVSVLCLGAVVALRLLGAS
jgi:energy-coupling factor transporter transmembrane protein EcfT